MEEIYPNVIKNQNRLFGMSAVHAVWIRTITIKYEYKLDNKNIKIYSQRYTGLTISN